MQYLLPIMDRKFLVYKMKQCIKLCLFLVKRDIEMYAMFELMKFDAYNVDM